MKYLKSVSTLTLTTALFYLAFPQSAYAAAGEGQSLTTPQLLLLGLVMGWYLYNHFKDKIKAFFKKSNDR